jgi:vacuolar iron transporter family protein
VEVERRELEEDSVGEHKELANIYVKRGLTPKLAREVAQQLMEHNALDAHLRDELGISETTRPRPIQAAVASAISYAVGALLPLLTVYATQAHLIPAVTGASLFVLTVLGAVAARTGGADMRTGAVRVLLWGAFAMAVTAGIGRLFGAIA